MANLSANFTLALSSFFGGWDSAATMFESQEALGQAPLNPDAPDDPCAEEATQTGTGISCALMARFPVNSYVQSGELPDYDPGEVVTKYSAGDLAAVTAVAHNSYSSLESYLKMLTHKRQGRCALLKSWKSVLEQREKSKEQFRKSVNLERVGATSSG